MFVPTLFSDHPAVLSKYLLKIREVIHLNGWQTTAGENPCTSCRVYIEDAKVLQVMPQKEQRGKAKAIVMMTALATEKLKASVLHRGSSSLCFKVHTYQQQAWNSAGICRRAPVLGRPRLYQLWHTVFLIIMIQKMLQLLLQAWGYRTKSWHTDYLILFRHADPPIASGWQTRPDLDFH